MKESKPQAVENQQLKQATKMREPYKAASHAPQRTSEGSKPLRVENQGK